MTTPTIAAAAAVDWSLVTACDGIKDPFYDKFDGLFSAQVDVNTLELYNASKNFHPFAFAAKVQSQDFPSYHEILRMDSEERLKWAKSMDDKISELAAQCF